ncbi:hypothetical protein BH10BAC5_BH10BAC5_12590 [soil metagenome]
MRLLAILKRKKFFRIFIIYTRYLIGAAFVFASLVKISGMRFTMMDGVAAPYNTPAHLFETLYQSGMYWKFLGWSQIIAAFLLMTQRYATIGAIVFLPIIANIFVITVSYGFTGTPYITGLMLLANIMLIVWDWDKIKVLFNLPVEKTARQLYSGNMIWEITGFVLFIFTVSYRLISLMGYNIFLWGGVCALIGLAGLVLGIRQESKLHYDMT